MARYRQLIRVESVDDNQVVLVIPGWDHRKKVILQRTEIPFEEIGTHLHAVIDIDAEDERMLFPTDWEPK